jgi:hypothetical protein
MNHMFNAQKLKITACALTGLMTFGAMGLTANAAEARSWHPDKPHYQELAHKNHNHHRKTHSQGDVNTAAIVGAAVGAIAGAVIAKNT